MVEREDLERLRAEREGRKVVDLQPASSATAGGWVERRRSLDRSGSAAVLGAAGLEPHGPSDVPGLAEDLGPSLGPAPDTDTSPYLAPALRAAAAAKAAAQRIRADQASLMPMPPPPPERIERPAARPEELRPAEPLDEPQRVELANQPQPAEPPDEPRSAQPSDEPRPVDLLEEPPPAERSDQPRRDEGSDEPGQRGGAGLSVAQASAASSVAFRPLAIQPTAPGPHLDQLAAELVEPSPPAELVEPPPPAFEGEPHTPVAAAVASRQLVALEPAGDRPERRFPRLAAELAARQQEEGSSHTRTVRHRSSRRAHDDDGRNWLRRLFGR